MSTQEIRNTVVELKNELDNMESPDSDTVETVGQLIDKLEQQLSEPEITDKHGLIEHMESLVEEFEITHPRLTFIVNDLMMKLASLGV